MPPMKRVQGVMSTVSPLVEIDWPTVAAAIATFVGTLYLSIKGLQKGKQKLEEGKSELTPIVGASLIETASIKMLSQQLYDNTLMMKELQAAVRENTAAVNRNSDIEILTHRN